MDIRIGFRRITRCICGGKERKSILKILDDSQARISAAEEKAGRKIPSRLIMRITRDLVAIKQNIRGDVPAEPVYLSDEATFWDYARIHNNAINRCRENILQLLEYSPELNSYFLELFDRAREERHPGQNYVGTCCTDQMRLGICGLSYV